MAVVHVSLPQNDMHRFQTGCDIGFGDLRSICFQHMGLGGFDIWHGGCQPLPQAQEIVHTIWGKFPVLRINKRIKGKFFISAHKIPSYLIQRITKQLSFCRPESVYGKSFKAATSGGLNDKCFQWAWIFKHLVPCGRCCLGRFRRYGLVEGGLSWAGFYQVHSLCC